MDDAISERFLRPQIIHPVMEVFKQHLSKIRVPVQGDKIYKDECMLSFDTPESPDGIYICLNTFYGFGRLWVEKYSARTGNAVFLHLIQRRRKVEESDTDGPAERKITKLAIGIEGGFPGGTRYEVDTETEVVVLPSFAKFPFPNPDLPLLVQESVSTILSRDSAAKERELEALSGIWDGEQRPISTSAEHLIQLDNGVKIPREGWKCQNCDKTDNLWLNLTDGNILCGRKFFDGTGGNNHAVEHYHRTNHPLAVKLGTIGADGKADVFDYQMDEMVEDPWLEKHLKHFGINVGAMKKTEKTMNELEIEMNQNMEWSLIQESGKNLTPLYGPGFTGMANLGNSCYVSSVMQILFSIPDFQKKYFEPAEQVLGNFEGNPTSDLNVQLCKLAHGLLSGRYSQAPKSVSSETDINEAALPGIKAGTFINLVGKNHPEFSTKRQQDAQEFFLYLINQINRSCLHQSDPTDALHFQVEDRIECLSSHKVKYMERSEFFVPVPIPMEMALNKKEVAEAEAIAKEAAKAKGTDKVDQSLLVRPKISLKACLQAFATPDIVKGFYSSATQQNTEASRASRFLTFPDYLMLQLRRFKCAEDWTPVKLDVEILVPETLDLEFLRSKGGLQPGEEPLPEEPKKEEPKIEINEAIVAQLVEMGFNREGCRKAVFHTANAGVEQAMNWVMDHMNDADFSEPLRHPGLADVVPSVNEEGLAMLMSMGFSQSQATKALQGSLKEEQCDRLKCF
ncbi:unnamed protein product [Cyprideis torosa]|uniref:ubiquitinyl hydrolase 1 n=1 Tax=Cyprideis torosa TaxID=163714 RepID=A0A7R8ZSL1_9CRUS|nr:unnamed protein product [Cyprideis torosa]CAG0895747.1 unnamed protein product [Cyprideis torosa]